MPVFEVQGPDGNAYEVDAPTIEAATQALNPSQATAPAQPAAPTQRQINQAQGYQDVKQSMAATPQMVTVPTFDLEGNWTGGYEQTAAPSKADPVGRGALSMIPFGEDIAAMSRGVTSGRSREQEREIMQGEAQAAKEAYPGAYKLGQGAVLGGQLAYAPSLAGQGATWLTRAGLSALEGMGYGLAYGAGEGITPEEKLKSGATGALTGGLTGGIASPLVEGVGALGSLAYQKGIVPQIDRLRAISNPEQVAAERVAQAVQSGSSQIPPQVFAPGVSNDQLPLMVADVGGEPARALARSAANISPEARQTLNEAITPRFQQQSDRVTSTVENMFPESLDYATNLESLNNLAREQNAPAYKRAFEQGSTGVFSPDLYTLTQASAIRKAMQAVPARASNRQAIETLQQGSTTPIVNPFDFDQAGNLIAKDGMKASDANLAYWDTVRQNLDSRINEMVGRNQTGGELNDLMSLRTSLNNALDDVVPSYQAARGTASKFFDAEDAYQAGMNFGSFNNPKKISQAQKAYEDFNPAEQELFARGYAANLLGKINSVKDNQSIINAAFAGSPTSRAKNMLALGPERANALETQLQYEKIMDSLRPAVQGGSTTARQLAEYGLAGAAGSALSGNMPTTPEGIAGALTGIALRAGKGNIDASVARNVANLLTSKDPMVLQRLMSMSVQNPQTTNILRTLANNLGRPAGIAAGEAQSPN